MRDPTSGSTGERIEALLEAASAGGRVARERAEELVRLVVDLYGAGLERLLEIVHESGRLDDELLDRLAADELVSSLLVVHGLHPYDVETRVARALDGVRPYLGSHGGDVELLGVTEDGVVRLRMLGSCDGCPSSSVTLTLAVETAIQAAAPETLGIEVEEAAPAATGGASVIPVSALRSRLDNGAVPGVDGGRRSGRTGCWAGRRLHRRGNARGDRPRRPRPLRLRETAARAAAGVSRTAPSSDASVAAPPTRSCAARTAARTTTSGAPAAGSTAPTTTSSRFRCWSATAP